MEKLNIELTAEETPGAQAAAAEQGISVDEYIRRLVAKNLETAETEDCCEAHD